jgi:hypothetical protein
MVPWESKAAAASAIAEILGRDLRKVHICFSLKHIILIQFDKIKNT